MTTDAPNLPAWLTSAPEELKDMLMWGYETHGDDPLAIADHLERMSEYVARPPFNFQGRINADPSSVPPATLAIDPPSLALDEVDAAAAVEDADHSPVHFTDLADIPVDSGLVLVVDPGNVPPLVLRWLLTPNEQGVTAGALLSTPSGDGWLNLADDGIGGLFGFMEDDEGAAWSVASNELRDIILGEESRP